MAIEKHVCTDHDTQRTFAITVYNGERVHALEEKVNGEWVEVPKDSDWWGQWQGEADSGAFEEVDPAEVVGEDYDEGISVLRCDL